ncbi:hypothetical protein CK203_095349 [Vitis vinifera]|uniref:Uncharacterized protein n=1 Tax=Vitis vinifera TaxID=29760 RepID=A0A438E6T5_VITVI|nr:hypothetical protein CK203_095349 [Vitis vinifera]
MVLLFSALGISWMLQNQVKDILGRLVGKEVLLQEKKVSMEYGPVQWIEKRSKAFEPTYLYTMEKGYFLLPEEAKSRHNIRTVNISISAHHSCFGNRICVCILELRAVIEIPQQFHYKFGCMLDHIHENKNSLSSGILMVAAASHKSICRYDTILINSLLNTPGQGYLYNYQTKEFYNLSYASELPEVLQDLEPFPVCRINLNKSEILPVGRVENAELLAAELGCKVGSLPSTYLGLPLGASHKSVKVWDGVEERMRKKLALWKRQFILREEESLSSGMGGLGIRNLSILNRALLCKWSWRFAVERDSYWKLIISSKYGIERGGWSTCGLGGPWGRALEGNQQGRFVTAQ